MRHHIFSLSPTALVATRFIGRYHGIGQLVTSHTWDSFRQENAFRYQLLRLKKKKKTEMIGKNGEYGVTRRAQKSAQAPELS